MRKLYVAVLAVQGAHMVEHVVQLYQTYGLHMPSDRALGLLGYLFDFHKTAEWIHLLFNVSLLISLLWLLPDVRANIQDRFRVHAFAGLACGVELWHMIEHVFIAGHMIANGGGCPCPGLLTFAPDVILHFVYNAVVLTGIIAIARPILGTYKRQPTPLQGRLSNAVRV